MLPGFLATADPMSAHQGQYEARQTLADALTARASEIAPIVSALYEFLGGNAGKIDWSKFSEDGQADGKSQGTAFLVSILEEEKSSLESTGTAAYQKLAAALDKCVKVSWLPHV